MAKSLTLFIGVVLLAVALLPMLWGNNPFVGVGDSVLFQTDFVHDAVHLLTGLILLLTALFGGNVLGAILKLFGVVYLGVAGAGLFLYPEGGALFAGVLYANMWDHYLHIALGIVLMSLGFLANKEQDTMTGLGSTSMRI